MSNDGALTALIKYLTTPKRVPQPSVVYTDQNKVGKTNVRQLRHWSENSEFLRAAIDIRKGNVSSAEWDVVPYDPAKPHPKRVQKQIRQLFDQPNPTNESFQTFVESVVEDILVLDAGAIEIERNYAFEPLYLWPVDGSEIKVSRIWDGDPLEARYFWWPDYQERGQLLNQDMLYIMQRPSTRRVVGLGNVEVLKAAIDAEMKGSSYNANQVATAASDGIFDLGENARPEQVEKFKGYWFAEVAGKAATAFWGGTKNAKWVDLRKGNRDMQFMEWQQYLAHKIAAVFEMHPADLGFTDTVNRATAEVQDQQTNERGAKRLLSTVQSHFTREIIWDPRFGGRANNLSFRFTKLNMRETLADANVDKIHVDSFVDSVNSIRIGKGQEPFANEVFDWPIAMTAVGAVSLMDVPTARELMESKTKSEPPSPQNDDALAAIQAIERYILEAKEAPTREELPMMVREAIASVVGQPKDAVQPVNVTVNQPHPASQSPQHTRFLYEDGRLAGKIESGPEGSVKTVFQFDETGRVIGKVREPLGIEESNG